MKRVLIFILLFSIKSLYSKVEAPVKYNDARVLGMGGTFTAVADDKNMLFYNPAGFADYGLKKTSVLDAIMDPTLWKPRYSNIGDLTLIGITFGINQALFDKYGYSPPSFKHNENAPIYQLQKMNFLEKFTKGTLTYEEALAANKYLNQLMFQKFHPSFNMEILSYARHYIGFGTFISADSVIGIQPGGFLPNPVGEFHLDAINIIGAGFHIPGYKRWSTGIALKYFTRAKFEVNDFNDILEIYQFAEGNYINKDIEDQLKTKSIFDLLTGGINYASTGIEQAKIGTGLGFDIGFMYRYSYNWRFGLQISDVYTRIKWWDKTESSAIPINARLGAAFKPSFSLAGLFEDPIFALDIEDIFHQQKKNFFLKWHFGTEFKFLFKIIKLRFGINEGYPSFGLGIDINFYFISKIPVIGWLRPDSVYFPKFDPNDKEFAQKNICCCILTGALAPLLYMHINTDISYTGYELGARPGDFMDYQWLVRTSISYSY